MGASHSSIMVRTTTFLLCVLLLLASFISHSTAMKRLHHGPSTGESENIIRGRALTNNDDDDDDEANNDSSDTEEDDLDPTSRHSHFRSPPRIVDFSMHLKRDVVLWEEVKTDGVRLHSCRFNKRSRRAVFLLSGHGLDPTDYSRNVVFVLDEYDYAACLGRHIPRLRGIDPADSQLFLSIRRVRNKSWSFGRRLHRAEQSIRVVAKVVTGRIVCPLVDIAVHDRPEPEAIAAMYNPVEYDDEPHSPWSAHFVVDGPVIDRGINGTVLPWISDRVTVAEREFIVGKNAKIRLAADVDVKVKKFKLRRSLKLKMTWQQEVKASVSAKLTVSKRISNSRRTGKIIRVFIPKLSFSIKLPIVGSMKAGGFVGLNWVAEMAVSRSLSAGFVASYTRKDSVQAQVIPPKMSVRNAGSSGKGKGSFRVAPTGRTAMAARGFYGVRPVVGMGVKYTYKKLNLKKLFKLKLKFKKKTKSISGNIGADFGVQVRAGFRIPPYPAYRGRGLTIGSCRRCHAVRGILSLKGKNFGLQAVKNGKIGAEKPIVKEIFDIRVATICALKRSCARS